MRKPVIALAIIISIVLAVPLFSAMEKWIIPVMAQIELYLDVFPHNIDFGFVFAQEALNKTLNVSLSEAFMNDESKDDIIYKICLEKNTTGQDLTQLLTFSKIEEDSETDVYCPGNSTLAKSANDTSDMWKLELNMPHIYKYDSNLPVLCRKIENEACVEPEQDDQGVNKTTGLYTAKIQIEILEISNVTSLFGEIHGMKFNDSDGNGIKGIGELGLPGWNITLTVPNSSVFWMLTNSAGEFSFTGLLPGTYYLTEVLQPDWNNTLSPQSVIIVGGTNSTGNDFGNVKCVNKTVITDLNIKLVLDRSGSMSTTFGSTTRAGALKNASQGFVNKSPDVPIINYTDKWWIGVEEFSTTVFEKIGLTPIGNAANKSLIINNISGAASGLTNITGAIDVAAKELNTSSRFGTVPSYLLLISDGAPTTGYGSGNFTQQAINSANAAKSQGIIIVTAGIALTNSTAAFMQSLATNSSTFINAATAEDLVAFFDNFIKSVTSCP